MKKYLFSVMALALAFTFTACEDDNDDNPTLVKATEFVLNNPVFQNQLVDLASTSTLNFTCSQPNFGYPIQCKYSLQYSLDGSFTTSVDEADADDTKKATYQVGDETPSCQLSISAANMAKGLEQIAKWTEGLVPSKQDVYVRVKAEPKAETAANVADYVIYSNAVKFTVTPYYVELADAPIVMWYLVGNLFGGKWGSEVGVSALPMFMVADYQYDKKVGTGELQYSNYFVTGDYSGNDCDEAGFKIQPDNFNWDLGMTGDNAQKGKIIFRNKGDDGGHIVAPENGYYLIKMNTADKTATMEKIDAPANTFTGMCLSGDFNSWGDTDMLPYNKEGIENHCWYYVFNITDADIAATGKNTYEFKFKNPGNWDNNWGFGSENGDINYRGIAGNGGKNLGLPAGKWCVSFNDIDGSFSIIAVN